MWYLWILLFLAAVFVLYCCCRAPALAERDSRNSAKQKSK